MKGKLYLIPCPITEGKDSSVIPVSTASSALKCKVFIVENVKHARRFLKALDSDIDIDSLQFYSMGKHAEPHEMADAIQHLNTGLDVGIMSDAGCPAVADPGWEAVHMAHEQGAEVHPLVGPSSILLTLMASGLNGQNFTFHGYLPIDKKERISALRNMISETSRSGITHLFMDTPFRNEKLFQDVLSSANADMRLCLAQDLTGPYQWIKTMSISDWKKKKPIFKKIPMMMALGH
jgi:16S rRNA (cytidine1402-2'-O)-methyltransferase